MSITSDIFQLAVELEQFYDRSPDDPDFAIIIDRFRIEDDAGVADLIEADGRLRLRSHLPVTLERYRRAIPDLARRSDPLDAAIDIALRAVARSSHTDEASVERLIAEHPDLKVAIRETAMLNNALFSTAAVRSQLGEAPTRDLPCAFGPVGEEGDHRYELQRLLGEGAFGQVYLAEDRRLSEEGHPALVAIKVLLGTDRSAWDRQRLIDEATKARRVDHPHVVRVLDRGISDQNEDFIVYEFVEGGDLGRWARHRRQSLNVRDAVRLTAEAARGVHAAHMAGLVHCDLKPNNIMVTSEGAPKVADFGIAIRADDENTPNSEPGRDERPLGNLAFMSPEQYRMEPSALTIPSDVYALGGILYWLLTGNLPNGATPEAVERTHRSGSTERLEPELRRLCRGADRDLASICRRALAVNPELRYDSAAGLAEDLENWLRREPIPWTRPSPTRRLTLWSRRKPALAVAAGLILALVVTGGAILQHLRVEAAVAEARLEEEERARREYYSQLEDWRRQLQTEIDKGMKHELLPKIWLSEWLYGPTVLGQGRDRFTLWDIRVDVVRQILKDARESGRDRDLETLLWEGTLGLWLIRQGQCEEAEKLLAKNLATLGEVLKSPDDPWLEDVRAMRTCATLRRLALADLSSKPSTEFLPQLTEAESILKQTEQRLNERHPGSPLHHLILEHLQLLWGPGMLDQPQRRDEVSRRLESLADE
ncbi:MAG: serine/threonine protein kinase [Phycisphaerales bacterium]|nr:MAG: serine/threonine protein kinase [Phycisphaerales bacterium]